MLYDGLAAEKRKRQGSQAFDAQLDFTIARWKTMLFCVPGDQHMWRVPRTQLRLNVER